MISAIAETFPGDGVLGEEGSFAGSNSRQWVVDPIDGTQAFDVGLPASTFCLALSVDGRPEIGVVYDPFLDRMYEATRGQGALCNGEKITVSNKSSLDKNYVFVSSRMQGTSVGRLSDALIDTGAKVFNIRSVDYGFMRVAHGAAIAAFAGPSHLWDFAAGILVLEEAGASISHLDGSQFDYATPEKGAVVSTQPLHPTLFELLKK